LGTTTNNGGGTATAPALADIPARTTIETVARGEEGFHTLAIVADLAVTTTSLPGGQVGVSYSAPVAGNGGVKPYAWSATGLPPGLTIDPASGAISGTPTTAGAFTPTIRVADADGIVASAPLGSTLQHR
jgi:hypothetical protein